MHTGRAIYPSGTGEYRKVILKQHRSDPHALKLAFIEACIDSVGYYNNKFMTQVFGNHVKDAARVTADYKRRAPGNLTVQSKALIPTPEYKRVILKPHTDAIYFIEHLTILHGSTFQ